MLRNWREWIIWPVTIGAMIAGAFGILASSHWIFDGREFVKGLGEAFFIAGFLAITVDQYVKKKMVHEASVDVSKYLIGYELPPEAQDRIKELMGCRVIRENYAAHYHATNVEMPGKLRLEVTIAYDIRNVTHQGEPYQQLLQIEAYHSPVIIELMCQTSDPKAEYCLKGRDVFTARDGLVEAYGPPIKVMPAKNKDGFTYRVSDKHSVIQPEDYSDLISFLAPTSNVRITADFPAGFTFVASGDKPSETTPTNVWEYKKLFLPAEHIRVRWYRNRMGQI